MIPNPFSIPQARQSPYLQMLAGVGGSYGGLYGGARRGLVDASGNLIQAGQNAIGPGEFDPGVAGLLATGASPVNNEVEDYFFRKFMADANNRVASRGLVGQGAGEGMLNDAARGYLMNRADTASGRAIASLEEANKIRTGQVGRAASLTGAGLSPYDTLSKLLSGQANAYAGAGALGNQVGIANARNGAYGNANAMEKIYNPLLKIGGGLAGGAYNSLFGGTSGGDLGSAVGEGTTSAGADVLRDAGGSAADSGGGVTDILGGFFDAHGGRVPGRGAYDHVRAVLTPQEFVIRRPVAERARPALESLNAGDFATAARKLARVASVGR